MAAAALALLPSTAAAAPPPDRGWIVGVAGSPAEARTLPCAGELPSTVSGALGGWRAVGAAVCFPKRSGSWHVDQEGACAVRSDATTAFRLMGDCVMTIDMGHYVKAWAPVGAAYEPFQIVWH